jgi:serine protease inhibitor
LLCNNILIYNCIHTLKYDVWRNFVSAVIGSIRMADIPSDPIWEFKIDQPFLYYIIKNINDEKENNISLSLFCGSVVEPKIE